MQSEAMAGRAKVRGEGLPEGPGPQQIIFQFNIELDIIDQSIFGEVAWVGNYAAKSVSSFSWSLRKI